MMENWASRVLEGLWAHRAWMDVQETKVHPACRGNLAHQGLKEIMVTWAHLGSWDLLAYLGLQACWAHPEKKATKATPKFPRKCDAGMASMGPWTTWSTNLGSPAHQAHPAETVQSDPPGKKGTPAPQEKRATEVTGVTEVKLDPWACQVPWVSPGLPGIMGLPVYLGKWAHWGLTDKKENVVILAPWATPGPWAKKATKVTMGGVVILGLLGLHAQSPPKASWIAKIS